jgi:hypothetical protein
MIKYFFRQLGVFAVLLVACAAIASAQTPNTGSIVVVAEDQNGAVVRDARVSVTNSATAATRDAVTGSDGSATIPALSLTGTYTVTVSKDGFGTEERKDITLRSGETATLKVTLSVGTSKAEVTIVGTTEGVHANPQVGLPLNSNQINETPVLGRKVTTLPLLNSAFRQGKGTGDLFVNATYFITGVGSRRATTFTLDGANNDEGWGRQTAITTLPINAVQEVNVLTNAFSAEYGWTSGPALNFVTKSGTNEFHGEGLFMYRPGAWQAETFSTKNYCPSSIPTCVTPASLQAINPIDIPDQLSQVSGTIGGPIIKDKTFFFVTTDYTWQNRTTFLSSTLPTFVLPADGNLAWVGHYRQFLFNGRVDHKLTSKQNLMFRFNVDRFHDDNPQDAVSGTSAPSVARLYARRSWQFQVNHTTVFNSRVLNEARFAYLHGDPVTFWTAPSISTTYTRAGAVPFTIGQSRFSDLWGHQFQFADTLSWTKGAHYLKFGGSLLRHRSGGTGSEPGTAILGTFTFLSTGARATLPFDQLTLADVQNYQQPINFGISSYDLPQWLLTGFVQDTFHVEPNLTLDLGLRYDRQTLTTATKNFQPRVGFAWHPGSDGRTSIRGGYAMYYTQIRANAVAGYLVNGLDGLTTYTAIPGQTGFPTCLTCVPVNVNPNLVPASQLPARDITIRAGQRDFYTAQFARFGLNFNKLPNYPDEFDNPRSQVTTIGVEREIAKGFFLGTDFVHQHLTGIDRTVDLNAPTPFDRTAPGQFRCPVGVAGPCTAAQAVAASNATRPITPANGGVRQVNVLMNLGKADYNGLQTLFTYRGNSKIFASVSYTLSKATNTTEPDGNGIGPNQASLLRQGEEERGPSVVDQRHRAVFTFSYRFPYRITAGTVSMFASSRPFNATTGVDNNGDGASNDRPVINGQVIPKSFFRGTPTSDVSTFIEGRIPISEGKSIVLRLEGFNLFNHANMLGRGQTIYSTVVGGLDTATVRPDFGVLTTSFTNSAGTNAIPAFANIDPPRMFQLQARFVF